jgi:hypothetical protein
MSSGFREAGYEVTQISKQNQENMVVQFENDADIITIVNDLTSTFNFLSRSSRIQEKEAQFSKDYLLHNY